jgi:formylglycine-generating enzyme required for sulfatase activity
MGRFALSQLSAPAMPKFPKLLILAATLLAAPWLHAAELKGLWEFDDNTNLGKATLGTNLTIQGATPTWSASTADASANTLSGVITTLQGTANRLLATHGIGANGGGAKTNEYTLVFDVLRPTGNLWRTFYQTSLTNGNDAEYFTRGGGGVVNSIGRATIGYSATAMPQNTWQRLVISVDLGSSFRAYINGSLFATHTAPAVDHADYSLDPSQILLFADNDGENQPLVIGAVAIYSGAVSAAEAAAFGGPGTPLLETNAPPVITEGSFYSIFADPDGPAVTSVFHATDVDGDPITWSIPTPPAVGSASIVSQSTSTCTVSYTPALGQTDPVNFTVRASDVDGNADITVQASILQTSTDPKTFYQENFDAALLQPEVTTNAQRRMPAGDNTSVWNTPAGTMLRLSSGPDLFLNAPASRVVEFTGFNLMRADFWRNGDDQGRSTAFAPGGNVIAVADSDEFPDAGGASIDDEFNVYLRTPPFRIPVGADASLMELSFTSSFRAEQNETSRVFVYHNGSNTPAAVLNVPNSGAAAAARVTYSWTELGSPAAGTVLLLEFAHEAADNNWWWAFDEIFVGIPNQAPLVTEGPIVSTSAPMGVPAQLTFNATDPDNDPITWSIATAASNGSAVITAQTSATCTFTYTSNIGFTGPDSFVVHASDGNSSTPVTVQLSVINTPPVIAEGETYQLSAIKNGAPRNATFTASDANGNPLAWSISTPAAHGSATVTSSTSGTVEVSYSPAPDYAGPDSFVVEVSDGLATDSILVQVTVSDPNADPILTIISPVGNATPPPGAYPHPVNTSLSPAASDVVTADTRHTCIGWSMTGDTPASGTASSFTFTLTRDSTLTWRWKTERLITTSVTGNGSVSVTTGWQDASRPLQINATAAAGHRFSGWTGDTSGCLTGGNSVVLPMNRPYGPITANFVPEENFTVIALPDTQNYTSISSPADTFSVQTQWVLDNRETLNIRFLTHLGDIVNSPTATSQWTRATDAMNLLNQQLAYGTCPGNHDLGSRDAPGSTTPSDYLIRFGPNPTHVSSTGRWIDPTTSQNYDWYRGSSPRGYSSYQIVEINGREFMFLHLDHDCPDADIAWAASVLSAHPRTLTMITTHNYLAETGGSGIFGTGTGERGYTAQPNVSIGPDRNKPEEVFNALVKPFNQVYMVICGHMFAIYNLEKTNDAGNNVHEVLCDYQSLPNGGNGFLRIMDFRPGENRILNTTYSPTLGRYIDPNLPADRQGMLDNHDPNGGEFELALDFAHRFDSTLTIASAFPDVSPAPGAHEVADGSPVVVSAEVQTLGNTRERPVAWNLSGAQNLSGTGDHATFVHEGNSTLTWIWQTEHYLETSTVGDGIVSTPSGWQSAGANVSITAQPDQGASFVAWTGDIAGCSINGAQISVPMNRPRGPITATFSSAQPSFAVTISSAYPSTTPAPATYTYAQGTEVTFSAALYGETGIRRVCTGYALSGGLTGSGTEDTVTLTVNGDFTLTWLWETEYQVLANSTGPGNVDPKESWVPAGGPLVLSGTPNSGAALTSWTGDTADGNPSGNTFTLPTVNRPTGPITANFALGMHTLTVVSAEDSVVPAPGPLVLPHGSVIHFSALPKVTGRSRKVPTGWMLDGSSPASGATTNGSFTLNGDATLIWSWSPEVYLELASGLEGRIQPMGAAGWKPLGAQVDLTAIGVPGYTFANWTGDVPANSTSPALSLTMDQPRLVAADFTPAVTAAGTPHWWLDTHAQVINGNYEAADLADADGDGQKARDEFLGGTDDIDPLRRFQVTSITPVAGPSLLLTWQSDFHRNYVVRSSPDLVSPFTDPLAPLAGQWPTTSANVPFGPAPRRFYQVNATLAPGGPLDADSPALSATPNAGSLIRDMRRIPTGWFTMGDNGGVLTSKPSHLVYVPGFDMDRYEVTRADWEKVVTWASANGYDLPFALPYDVPANHPAVAVSWYQAVKWCNARSEMEGRVPSYRTDATGNSIYRTGSIDLNAADVNWSGNGYRLPTEAEWERASRGGLESQPYPWGNADPLLRANHWNYALEVGTAPTEAYPYTIAVGSFGSAGENSYGLFDMVGNAWEWTWDRMSDYTADSQIAPRGPDSGSFRVLRGGSWWNYVDQSTNYQRLDYPPTGNDDYGQLGFRCVRGLHPNE